MIYIFLYKLPLYKKFSQNTNFIILFNFYFFLLLHHKIKYIYIKFYKKHFFIISLGTLSISPP